MARKQQLKSLFTILPPVQDLYLIRDTSVYTLRELPKTMRPGELPKKFRGASDEREFSRAGVRQESLALKLQFLVTSLLLIKNRAISASTATRGFV